MRTGFGRAVITPPLPVALAGFSGRMGPATEVHDDLEVRTVWLSSGGDADGVCLLVFDLLGMSAEFADPIRAAVGRELGLPRSAVLTACIHTHAGPNVMTGGEALGWPTPAGYDETLVTASVAAARQARSDAEPAVVRFARGPLPDGLSINRRGNPYAPTMAVMDARTPAGDRLGTLANVAIHPVAMGIQTLAVSADWVGAFRPAFEDAFGGRAVLLSGALGDVNPALHTHDGEEGGHEDAERVGRGVAVAAGALLATAADVGEGVEVTRSRIIEAPAAGLLATLAQTGDRMDVELIEWKIGSTRLVSIPGEAFHALGNAIESVRDDPLLLAGLAPVWQGYLPDPFGEGYEESVSFGREAVAAIRDALLEVAPA